jgi:hypothetical protein
MESKPIKTILPVLDYFYVMHLWYCFIVFLFIFVLQSIYITKLPIIYYNSQNLTTYIPVLTSSEHCKGKLTKPISNSILWSILFIVLQSDMIIEGLDITIFFTSGYFCFQNWLSTNAICFLLFLLNCRFHTDFDYFV